MATFYYKHTKHLIATSVSLGSDTLYAAAMNSSYIFDRNHKSLPNVSALREGTDQQVILSTSVDEDGTFRATPSRISFPSMTASIGSIVIYADGVKGGIDRPLLFYVGLRSVNELRYARLIFTWDIPLISW